MNVLLLLDNISKDTGNLASLIIRFPPEYCPASSHFIP